jgi:DNA-binding GntR family transcriptional regulator
MMHNYEFKMHSRHTTLTAHSDSTALAPRRALYEEVAERLREQIYNRVLEPGTWIDEQRLAVEYGISRTPLREALKVLAAEGLVTMKVRRGAYVTEMSTNCCHCWRATPRPKPPAAPPTQR